ncbi:hypothetical protein JZ751_006469 [Albula glossodonta]|uniref:Uncharacterized protein n=1 Tax=Albula glossodonta TaxID=121402 RepID=A0A8T2NEA3_9TELE|nr:hypothetical protein JZ751_006469 [Albula glossodonta]
MGLESRWHCGCLQEWPPGRRYGHFCGCPSASAVGLALRSCWLQVETHQGNTQAWSMSYFRV